MRLSLLILVLIEIGLTAAACRERPVVTPDASVKLRPGQMLNLRVLAEAGCADGVIKEIQAVSDYGSLQTVYETVEGFPSQLYLIVNFGGDVAFLPAVGCNICVRAIDENDVSSKESCFQVLPDDSSRFLLKATSSLISQSLPLCNQSSFALLFVYYWLTFGCLHVLSLVFITVYSLRSMFEEGSAMLGAAATSSVMETSMSNNNQTVEADKSFFNNNNTEPENQHNKNYRNEDYYQNNRSTSNDSFNSDKNNYTIKSSLLYPLPKRDFFFASS